MSVSALMFQSIRTASKSPKEHPIFQEIRSKSSKSSMDQVLDPGRRLEKYEIEYHKSVLWYNSTSITLHFGLE